MCFSCICLFVLYVLVFVMFLFLLVSGLAAICDCGTPWTFLLTVFSTVSNIFYSETFWLIEAKFHVEPPWNGGRNLFSNGPGHMTKLAAMPTYIYM